MSGIFLMALAGCAPPAEKPVSLRDQLGAAKAVALSHPAPQKNSVGVTIEQSFSTAFGNGSVPFLLMNAACQKDTNARQSVMVELGKWVPDANQYWQDFQSKNLSLSCQVEALSADFELVKSFVREHPVSEKI
jgi:hypothetical protein